MRKLGIAAEFTRCMHTSANDIHHILQHVRGGWEVWAQVQMALFANQNARNKYVLEREVPYPWDDGRKCDFRLIPEREQTYSYWVELKVQLHDEGTQGEVNQLARKFIGDCDKITEIGEDWDPVELQNNELVALCYCKTFQQALLEKLKVDLTLEQQNLISYHYFDGNVMSTRRLTDPIAATRNAIVCSYSYN